MRERKGGGEGKSYNSESYVETSRMRCARAVPVMGGACCRRTLRNSNIRSHISLLYRISEGQAKVTAGSQGHAQSRIRVAIYCGRKRYYKVSGGCMYASHPAQREWSNPRMTDFKRSRLISLPTRTESDYTTIASTIEVAHKMLVPYLHVMDAVCLRDLCIISLLTLTLARKKSYIH